MEKQFENFRNEVNLFLAKKFEINHGINNQLKITEALSLDSLDLIDLVVYLEEEYKVKVKAENFADFNCLNDLHLFLFEETQALLTK